MPKEESDLLKIRRLKLHERVSKFSNMTRELNPRSDIFERGTQFSQLCKGGKRNEKKANLKKKDLGHKMETGAVRTKEDLRGRIIN